MKGMILQFIVVASGVSSFVERKIRWYCSVVYVMGNFKNFNHDSMSYPGLRSNSYLNISGLFRLPALPAIFVTISSDSNHFQPIATSQRHLSRAACRARSEATETASYDVVWRRRRLPRRCCVLWRRHTCEARRACRLEGPTSTVRSGWNA